MQLARAYNRWLCDKVLVEEPRIRSMLYLPFNHPEGCIKMVEDFADKKGVIGFMVTAPRHRGVFDNCYMRLYSMLEERGLPLAFHGGFSWRIRISTSPTGSSWSTRWASPSSTCCISPTG